MFVRNPFVGAVGLVLTLCLLAAKPAHALQRQIIECRFFTQPFGSVVMPEAMTGSYRITRQWERMQPSFVFPSSGIWDGADFENIGTSLLTIYLTDESELIEEGSEPFLRLVDYHNGNDDQVLDSATGSGQIRLEGWVVDSFGFTIDEADGTLIDDHLTVPELVPEQVGIGKEPDGFGGESPKNPCFLNLRRVSGGRIDRIAGTLSSYEVEGDDSFELNAGLNDAWFAPATAGQGFFIVIFPKIKQVFLAWFTYDTERPGTDIQATLGEPGHRWLTAQGPYEGNAASLNIVLSTGGVFDSAVPEAENSFDGTIDLVFDDCESGTLSYHIESLGLGGDIPIQRITPDNLGLCEVLSSSGELPLH